jgi:hypothetical protein
VAGPASGAAADTDLIPLRGGCQGGTGGDAGGAGGAGGGAFQISTHGNLTVTGYLAAAGRAGQPGAQNIRDSGGGYGG